MTETGRKKDGGGGGGGGRGDMTHNMKKTNYYGHVVQTLSALSHNTGSHSSSWVAF